MGTEPQVDSREQAYREWRFVRLWELWDDWLFEFFGDTRKFFSQASDEERVALTERLLRELWSDGFATFVRRSSGHRDGPGRELDAADVEALLAGDTWHRFTSPVTGDGIEITLAQTEKQQAWRESQNSPDPLPPHLPAGSVDPFRLGGVEASTLSAHEAAFNATVDRWRRGGARRSQTRRSAP